MDTILGLMTLIACLGLVAGLIFMALVVLPGIQEKQAESYLDDWLTGEGLSMVSRSRIRLGTAGVWPPGQIEYRIVVEDRAGSLRYGRAAVLGTWYRVKVRWEEPEANRVGR